MRAGRRPLVPAGSPHRTGKVRYTGQMPRTTYAEETERTVEGSGTFRTFGPASPRSIRASKNVRRTVYPVIANWRPTRRGILGGRRAMEAVLYTRPMRGTLWRRLNASTSSVHRERGACSS